MSEPEEKLDLTSLNDALQDEKDDVAKEAKASLQGDEGYQIGGGDDDNGVEASKVSSDKAKPASGEADSAASEAKERPADVKAPASDAKDAAHTTRQSSHDAALDKLDPTSRQIKAMFPDIETDTIQAVVAAEGGDFERAINTLLQMSDPSYVPPPPLKETTQTRNDAELARVLAHEEEEHARHQQQQRAQQDSSFFPPSARGGALGSLLGAVGGGTGRASSPNEQRAAQPPSYDPTNLAYQPRVRRTTSGTAAKLPPSQASFAQGSSSPGGSVSPVWPGPKEAKAWQEDINKMAETGFAKAASTFSALRQRGEQTLQGIQQNRAQGQASPAGATPGTAQGGQGSFFSSWTQRKNSNSAVSPNINSGKGFDRDASPVGDNELAKILARGRDDGHGGSAAGQGSAQRKASTSNAMLERYKSGSNGERRSAGKFRPVAPQAATANADDEDDDDLGWDDAGRTGAASKEEKAFQPIKINDGTSSASKQAPPVRNAVSLMEGSTSRGISPSPRNKSTDSADADRKGKLDATSTGKSDEEDHDDGNSDDLEYVANPFEDDD